MRTSILFYILLQVFQPAIAHSQEFKINGSIDQMEGKKVFIAQILGRDRVRDSAVVNNGKFIFKGTIPGPIMLTLSFRDPQNREYKELSLFIEPSEMHMVIQVNNLRAFTLEGSKSHLVQEKYSSIMYAHCQYYIDELNKIRKDLEINPDNQDIKRRLIYIDSSKSVNCGGIRNVTKNFILDNPNTGVSSFLVNLYSTIWETDTVLKYYNGLSVEMQNAYYGILTRNHLLKSVTVGMKAPEFSKRDVNNTLINLADYKGKKYVLLDFWASWCIPCISELPELKEFYKSHKSQVEILGLSMDEDVSDWKNSIRMHNIPWRQIQIGIEPELKTDRNYLGNLYTGVSSIPRQFLINPEGIIVGIFLSAPMDIKKLVGLIK